MNSSFDSILVRLKGFAYNPERIFQEQFRFHTGSIKSGTGTTTNFVPEGFRFHTGSIKSIFTYKDSAHRVCFDSILVRLKAAFEKTVMPLQDTFRFHTGSIKRKIADNAVGNNQSFDSILVRLKVNGDM